MKTIRNILFLPVLVILHFILKVRNVLFDLNIIPSVTFNNISTISIGNLTVGGTGKTPHIEYLVKIIKPILNHSETSPEISILSRGYGRKTKGYFLSDSYSTCKDIGDEPLQFKTKFSEMPVAVDENRVRGIKTLFREFPSLRVVLLDDAFQHRRISAGLSILLTDYSNLYVDDQLFPFGTLREPASGSDRADIIIVTKGSKFISPLEQRIVKDKLHPKPHQRVYFSHIEYGELEPLNDQIPKTTKHQIFNEKYTVVLFTGIAKSSDLVYFLKDQVHEIIHIKYPDHYFYSGDDILRLKDQFNKVKNPNKIIITTEKDAMRLKLPELQNSLTNLPIHYIPINIIFNEKDKEEFNNYIFDYVRRNQINSGVYKRKKQGRA